MNKINICFDKIVGGINIKKESNFGYTYDEYSKEYDNNLKICKIHHKRK